MFGNQFLYDVRVTDFFKRFTDFSLAAFALLCLSPFLFLIALVIKLTSSGPVFFVQSRVGLAGNTFDMLKFRTMVVDAEEQQAALAKLNTRSGPTFKIQDDPRITKVGHFLRKHSLDELPQLFNILFGDMSVVGPRPPVPKEVAEYETWHYERFSVRPGLTCYWQVSNNRDMPFDEWVESDLKYIAKRSIWLDAFLVLKTFPVVIFGRN
jgi:lipopolysaccharide/colanic/teichoic acid biosynthesis glycosyltransferase